MPEKPPSWSPFGEVGQVPIAVSQDVNTAGVDPSSGQDAHSLASQIVRQQLPVIFRFIANQRQQIEISGRDIRKATLPLEDMDVHYSYIQGLERMHFHVSPRAGPPTPPEEQLLVGEPTLPEVPKPPEVTEPELPQVPEAKIPEAKIPELEKPPEKPKEEELEKEAEKKAFGHPNFLTIDVPYGLAVEFGDGAGDP